MNIKIAMIYRTFIAYNLKLFKIDNIFYYYRDVIPFSQKLTTRYDEDVQVMNAHNMVVKYVNKKIEE